jgi:uncharacterized protein (TIGR02145 family)
MSRLMLFIIIGLSVHFFTNSLYAQTVKDIEGNTYTTVKIGDQLWMVENLKVKKYSNGDPIPLVVKSEEWGVQTTGAYCNYYHDESNIDPYGRLYNWYAVTDPRGLCPTGWHVPTIKEWKELFAFLGGEDYAAGKLKSQGNIREETGLWIYPNAVSEPSSGFNGHPGGYRRANGEFVFLGLYGNFWSSSEYPVVSPKARFIYLFNQFEFITLGDWEKTCGFSVRCMKD